MSVSKRQPRISSDRQGDEQPEDGEDEPVAVPREEREALQELSSLFLS